MGRCNAVILERAEGRPPEVSHPDSMLGGWTPDRDEYTERTRDAGSSLGEFSSRRRTVRDETEGDGGGG
eukprot:8127837-Pyramimonas_sp.AAC.1